MQANLNSLKRQWRKNLSEKRSEFSRMGSDQWSQWGDQLAEHAFALKAFAHPPYAIFKSLPQEAPTDALIRAWGPQNFAFPKVNGDSLSFYRVQAESDFEIGPFGLVQPDPQRAKLIDVNDCSICFVPGLGFGRHGERLGYGKGYYDKSLKDFKGLKVGLCLSFQFVEEDLPTESHDISMDYILTESFLYKVLQTLRRTSQ